VPVETPRLLLRPFRDDDLADLVREADDPRIAAELRDRFPSPYTEAAAREWIAYASTDAPPLAALAIALDDRVIGGIGLERFRDVARFTAELGYWLGVAHWGRGYAAEAIGGLVDHAFATTDLRRVEAWVFVRNERSARVLERCGFRQEGRQRDSVFKNGEFLDTRLFARLRDDPPPPATASGA